MCFLLVFFLQNAGNNLWLCLFVVVFSNLQWMKTCSSFFVTSFLPKMERREWVCVHRIFLDLLSSNEKEQLWAWEYMTDDGKHDLYIDIGEEIRLVRLSLVNASLVIGFVFHFDRTCTHFTVYMYPVYNGIFVWNCCSEHFPTTWLLILMCAFVGSLF